MKIVSLHIQRFGKLKDVNLNFCNGINVFQRQNGFGKTTLAAFIRAMLFGFKYNSSKLSTGERGTDVSRWLPWDADGRIGGSLTVEQNGNIYRIERSFGAKASQETLAVYNEKNGKKLDVQNVGETFLGLTAESFDRSAYFPQESVEIASNENLDSRLAGLVQNAEDYNAVCNRLADFRKKLSLSRGKGGLIFELETQETDLHRQIYERKRALARQKEINGRLAQIAVEKAAAENDVLQCNQRAENLQKQVAQAQLSAEQLANEQKTAALQEKLNRQKDLPQDFETCRQLAEKISQTPQEVKTQRQLSLPLLIAGLALSAAGVGLCFWQTVVGICVAAIGVACSILAFFVRPALTTLPSGEKDALISQYFAIVSKYAFCNNLDYPQAQKVLWDVYRQYIGDKSAFDALCETRSATKRTEDVENLQQTLENVKQRANQAQQRLQQLANESGALSSERSALNTDAISVSEQLANVQTQLLQARKQLETVNVVLTLLEQAKENLSTSYLPTLSEQCGKLLNAVTNGRYEVKLDRNFTLRLQENGVTKPSEYFSRGIREITLLCFRIALSQMLYGGKIPLLIIDDAFVNFDEENFLQATKLLKNLSQSTQIVYFTCHERLGALK